MTTATDATAETYYLEQVAARFGPRTHLQLKECAEMIGLKTTGPFNEVIAAGTLEARSLFGHYPRLRWVTVPEFARFLCAAEPLVERRTSGNPHRTVGGRERLAIAAVPGGRRALAGSRRGRGVR